MERVRVAVLLLALALPVSAFASASPPGAVRLARELDRWSEPLVRSGALAGQLLIARHGEVLLERAWGEADRELHVPMRSSTRLNIASITKPMTVMIATQLIQEHRLALADTLSRWLPGFPQGGRITVEHLLRHRSGIPHRVTTAEQESQPQDAASIAARASGATLLFRPGEKSSYSSAGFSVLARVLELAAEQPYDTLLARYVFLPAGMTQSTNAGARTIVPERAASYVPGATGYENAPLQDLSFLVGAGSVWSTARDVHKLLRAVVTGAMGEGARLSWVRSGRLDWNGSTNGFRAFASHDSTSGLEIVWCGNVHTGAPDLLRAAIEAVARGESPAPPMAAPARITLADSTLRALEGVYLLANGVRLEVRARSGMLFANDWPMIPVGQDRFFSPRDYGDVSVRRGSDHRIERLDWVTASGSLPAARTGDLPAP